jgi:putative tryptophan/tyrosine transport system substrate-binding protein
MLGGAAMGLGWPGRAAAQPASVLPLVAVLWPGRPETEVAFDAAMRSGMKDSGFVEGTNFTFVMRYANADFARLKPLASELAGLQPRVIITGSDEAVLAAHGAAPTVPLVMASVAGDPVALGLAQSYPHPGGSVTGWTMSASGGEEALTGKRMGLLKELLPGLARLGLIIVTDTRSGISTQNGATAATARLSLDVLTLPVRTLDDIEAAFAAGLRAEVGAFYIEGAPLTFTNRAKVAELAARAGKPTLGGFPEQARAGLLMAYSADLVDIWRRSGEYVVKILAGAKPGDLPIEQPSKYAFVINLKTAKSLGLVIPPALLARADEVIE